MRWLQWSTIDLENGKGGVEVCARSLRREFEALEVRCTLSSDPQALQEPWDVIHTHASWPLTIKARRPAFHVHTLHGTMLGRIAACGEWRIRGGYRSYLREIEGIWNADLVASIHPRLHLLDLARLLRKPVFICGNGWDSAIEEQELPPEIAQNVAGFGPFFCFVGRGGDRMKNAEFLRRVLERAQDIRVVACPGEGLTGLGNVLPTGPLSSPQVQRLMSRSKGLVLSSLYEGLPLVVLEGLARGVPVFSSRVGGLGTLPNGLRGLTFLELSEHVWIGALRNHEPPSQAERDQAAIHNRAILPTWKHVASGLLGSVKQYMKRR